MTNTVRTWTAISHAARIQAAQEAVVALALFRQQQQIVARLVTPRKV